MWKRLNKGARQSMSIGDPVLQETTLDANAYPGLGVGLESEPQQERAIPPQRPSRGDVKGLPSLPFESMPPSPPEHEEMKYRPESSIYSDAMPPPLNTRLPRDSYATVTTTYTEDEISPPSSPDFGRPRRRNTDRNTDHNDDDDVSPIDESPDISRLNIRTNSIPAPNTNAPSSNIPVLRKERRRDQFAAAAAKPVQRKEIGGKGRPVHDPRWDPYSGEITTSDRGKPQSVKPGEYVPPQLRKYNNGPAMGVQTEISSEPKAHTSFSDRVRKLKNSNAPAERPGWRGASGRVTLVNPVADQPDVKPLNIPRKSSKRVTSPRPRSPVSVMRRDETGNPLTSNPARNMDHTLRTVRSVTNDTERSISPISVIHDPVVISQSAAVKTQARGHPTPRPVPDTQHLRDESEGSLERNFRDTLAESYPQNRDPYVEPPSRFSVTTYAPSEAQTTPRPSTDEWDRPTVPAIPDMPDMHSSPQQSTPILNRKRPKVIGEADPSARVVSRKAIPPSSPVFVSMKTPTTTTHQKRQSTASQLSKNLPQTPTEASSHDLITSLEAQVENLQHRRKNIERSIRQMTELMPQDRITITAEVKRKREEEKRKVEGLREEEASVRREEHEIGLRLHRAYKRKDKDAVYEPTGLWVRRVTG